MIRSYHIYVNLHFNNFCDKFLDQRRKEQQDICIVLGGVAEEFRGIYLVIEPLAGSPVLPETVAGQQQLVFRYI